MAQGEGFLNTGMAKSPVRFFGRGLNLALDVLLPPQCLGCGELVDGGGLLCAPCWDRMEFPGPPCCDACGLPFEYHLGDGALCGACTRRRPPYHRARAALTYDDNSRRLVLAFKHGDRTEAAPAFGRWLARAGAELIADADLVTPVPLHWTRLFTRRFNQSALLAHGVSRMTDLPVAPDLLIRRRRTPSQGRLSPPARRRNVSGAFTVRSSQAERIRDKRVLVIDDVMTTGATAEAVSRTLLRSGAAAVDVLTLARVQRTA